jgi:hypothetical protein
MIRLLVAWLRWLFSGRPMQTVNPRARKLAALRRAWRDEEMKR